MAVSQNGYRANDTSVLDTFTVPGSKVRLRLRKGPVATVLLYVAARFDDEVEDIDTAQTYRQDAAPSIPGGEPSTLADDWSYAERPIRGSTTTLSNHASGTAIDLNATQHPRGSRTTFTRGQTTRVRAILAALHDAKTRRPVVRWGQDYVSAPTDGMHFEIDADETAVARVAAQIQEDDMPTAAEIADVLPTAEQIGQAVMGQVVATGVEGRVTAGTALARTQSELMRLSDLIVASAELDYAIARGDKAGQDKAIARVRARDIHHPGEPA